MKPAEGWIELVLPASILWVVDFNRVVVVHPDTHQAQALHGLEAAIWGWLTLDYPYPRLLEFVKVAQDQPQDVAEKRLLETLRNWIEAGFLVVVGDPG